MGFKAAFKKLRRKVGLPAITLGTTGRVVAAAVTRGKSEKVIGQLKGVGAALQAVKANVPRPRITKAEAAHVLKSAVRAPRVVPISAVQATTMPGGAPLTKTRRASKPRAAKRAAKAPRKSNGGGGRKPPKGGLDLKGLSASWKAAGKPGTWQAWIASHK